MFLKFHAQVGIGELTYYPVIIVVYAAGYICNKPHFLCQKHHVIYDIISLLVKEESESREVVWCGG